MADVLSAFRFGESIEEPSPGVSERVDGPLRALLSSDLTLAHAFSIGLKWGLLGYKNKSAAPAAPIAFRTR